MYKLITLFFIYFFIQSLKSQNSIIDIFSIKTPVKESNLKQSNILKKWGI